MTTSTPSAIPAADSREVEPIAKSQTALAPKHAIVVRIGTLGGRGAGKSVLATALSLPRQAHPKKLTATQIPLSANASRDLMDGWEFIKECRGYLKQGKTIPGTAAGPKKLITQYRVTDGAQREHFLEMRDYGGELMDPDVSAGENASRLREALSDMDALIVMASHPKPGEDPSALSEDLSHLQKVFAQMRKEQLEQGPAPLVPIVMLVNKWDRSGRLDNPGFTEESEKVAVDQFLARPDRPPHAALLDELRMASPGFCEVFPISAYGPATYHTNAQTGETIELPVQVSPCLKSFGLEAPFLWLIDQKDMLDLQKVEAEARWPRTLFNPAQVSLAKRAVKQLLHRLSPGSAARDPATRLYRRVKLTHVGQCCAGVLLALFSVLGIESAFDHRDHVAAVERITSPKSTHDNRLLGERWYHAYIGAVPWRHRMYGTLWLNREEAKDEVHHLWTVAEEAEWKQVLATEKPDQRAALATGFAEHFPASRYITDVKRILLGEERRLRILAVNQRFDDCEKELATLTAALQPRPGLDLAVQREQLGLTLEHMSTTNQKVLNESKEVAMLDDDALLERLNQMSRAAKDAIAQGDNFKEIVDVEGHYRELWAEGHIISAGRFLLEMRKTSRGFTLPGTEARSDGTAKAQYEKTLATLNKHFSDEGLAAIRQNYEDLLKDGSGWRAAISLVNDLAREDADAPGKGPELAALAVSIKKSDGTSEVFDWPVRLKGLRQEAVVKGEEYDFQQLGDGRNPRLLATYLENFTPELKTLDGHVARHILMRHLTGAEIMQEWLNFCAQPQTVRVTLRSINWSAQAASRVGAYPRTLVTYSVTVAGDTGGETLNLSPYNSSGWVGESTVTFRDVRPDSGASFAAYIVVPGRFISDDDLGSVSNSINSLSALQNAMTITTQGGGAGGQWGNNKLTFEVQVLRNGKWENLRKPELDGVPIAKAVK